MTPEFESTTRSTGLYRMYNVYCAYYSVNGCRNVCVVDSKDLSEDIKLYSVWYSLPDGDQLYIPEYEED